MIMFHYLEQSNINAYFGIGHIVLLNFGNQSNFRIIYLHNISCYVILLSGTLKKKKKRLQQPHGEKEFYAYIRMKNIKK